MAAPASGTPPGRAVRGGAAVGRLRLLHVSVAAALLALIIWKTGVGEARDVLAGVDARLLACVVVLNVPLALLFPLRSHLVLRRLGARVDPRLLVPSSILGNVAGSLTPASSGELLRTTMLHAHARVATEDAMALVLYERALSVWLMSLGTAAVTAFVALPLRPALIVGTIALVLLAMPAAVGRLLQGTARARPDSRVGRALGRARHVAHRVGRLVADRRLLVTWSLVTATIFAVNTLQFWLLARSVSHAISPPEAWIALGTSQLAGIVSLLPLGFGVADGSLAAVLRKMGATLDQATVVAVLVRATITLPLGLLACASYLYLLKERRPAAGPALDVAPDAA